MDQDIDGDGAINLSTSQRPSAATTPNDGIQPEDVEQVSPVSISFFPIFPETRIANIKNLHRNI